jgi:hypothetical protein
MTSFDELPNGTSRFSSRNILSEGIFSIFQHWALESFKNLAKFKVPFESEHFVSRRQLASKIKATKARGAR